MARISGLDGETTRLVGELVSSPQRRTVVRHLTDNGGAATFDDVVDVLVEGPDRMMAAIRLHHVHLPKLQAAGAIDWDYETGEVRLTAQGWKVIDGVDDHELFTQLASD